jgi:hypothetical protein
MRLSGRKSSLTPRVADELVLMFRQGVSIGVACAAVNVSPMTYHRWMARTEPVYLDLQQRVRQAQARSELALVLDVVRQGRTNWRAAAFMLERTKPEQYGRLSDRRPDDDEPRVADPFSELWATDDVPA